LLAARRSGLNYPAIVWIRTAAERAPLERLAKELA
jgi:hypothetical protein